MDQLGSKVPSPLFIQCVEVPNGSVASCSASNLLPHVNQHRGHMMAMRTGVDTALLRSLCLGTIDIDKPVAPRQPTPRTHGGDANWCRYGPAKISLSWNH